MEQRGNFTSKIGVVLATVGSAVGLGNVWRFPTEVGNNGGAAFILIYLACVLFIGVPVMVSEFVIGRSTHANTITAYRRLAPGTWWRIGGIQGVFVSFLIFCYYIVVAGWTLHYTVASAAGELQRSADFGQAFNGFVSAPWPPIGYLAAFMLLTHFVVARGIQAGIERYSKVMMPLLLIIIVLLVGCSLMMPGAGEGLRFLLKPDINKITSDVVLSAMGQAFFSLSVGIGCLVTYSSYFNKDTRLVRSAMNVCVIDTLVAVLSGFIIFPTVFSVGLAPDAGPGLVFITLPNVFRLAFDSMPWVGYAFSLLFYVLLLLAALTSSISMHEICTAFISEHFHLRRSRAACAVTLLCIVLGACCSLSFGAWKEVTLFGRGFFDLFDFTVTKFLMPLGGLLMTFFVGWYLDRRIVVHQLTNGGKLRIPCLGFLLVLIRWIAPLGILVIFLNELLSNS